ncbi:hypothetical protein RR21198_4296 [Rhodococcus rhodochrous ATCC 21198]|uniref:hypothetical protein n=2 Tax=Rhodococcus aetherivorans TaxID=191292 RepID=UPI0003E29ACE|nr:hypothetical protein [Rhodococcus aetherivorans]ETT24896.1 hypothetical protein RR21198_4296 [Rhodococcus rhodochrous ATCC 21198]NGP25830.1 hypothetical protein [Rhodococcus aetherivorans]
MSQPNGPSPRTRSLVVGIVVALWGTSVSAQIISQFFRFEWVAPTGLNEIMTAVVMWLLARNHQAAKADQPPPPPPAQQQRPQADREAESSD